MNNAIALVPSGSKITPISRTLAPGEEFPFKVDCRFFYFLESSYGFQVKIDDGPFLPLGLATGYRCEDGEAIQTLTIKNTLDKENSFVLIVGRGQFIDLRQNVLENRNGSAASLTPNGLTESVNVTVPYGEEVAVPANPNRKSAFIRVDCPAFAGDYVSVLGDGNDIIFIKYVDSGGSYKFGNVYVCDISRGDTGTILELKNYSGTFSVFNGCFNSTSDLSVTVTEKVFK